MPFIYLSIIGSILVIIGYIPEIYYIIKHKKADIENIYIWLIWSCASIFSLSYCLLNNQFYVMATYIIIFIMNTSTLLIKLYYFYNNNNNNNNIFEIDKETQVINPILNI
jgi:CDP-diglyceride synthetase